METHGLTYKNVSSFESLSTTDYSKSPALDTTNWLVVNNWSFSLSEVMLAPHWMHVFIPLKFAYFPSPHGAHSTIPSSGAEGAG